MKLTRVLVSCGKYRYPGKVPLDARDAKLPPIKPLRAAASTCPRWIHLGQHIRNGDVKGR
jgi:hypothetical protein